MGNGISQEHLIQKVTERIYGAYAEGFVKVTIYFNKPKSKRIDQALVRIYHSRAKISREQIEQFVKLYHNDSMAFRWNNAAEALIVDFCRAPTERLQRTRQSSKKERLNRRKHNYLDPMPPPRQLTERQAVELGVSHEVGNSNSAEQISDTQTEPGVSPLNQMYLRDRPRFDLTSERMTLTTVKALSSE